MWYHHRRFARTILLLPLSEAIDLTNRSPGMEKPVILLTIKQKIYLKSSPKELDSRKIAVCIISAVITALMTYHGNRLTKKELPSYQAWTIVLFARKRDDANSPEERIPPLTGTSTKEKEIIKYLVEINEHVNTLKKIFLPLSQGSKATH